MSTLVPPQNPETNPRVKAVFDDIRNTRGSDFINNIWRYLAFDPELLEQTWRDVKEVMAKPSALDPLTKELIYVAVSVVNGCEYCVHSHTASARAKGMDDAQYADLLRVISLAAKTNQLAQALQLPVDPEFEAEKSS
ncbi:MAG: carboxymuconolactone decarboxylase family protein [Hyphomicrobiales bacterium]